MTSQVAMTKRFADIQAATPPSMRPMIVLMTAVACSGVELLVPLIVAGLPVASLTDAL